MEYNDQNRSERKLGVRKVAVIVGCTCLLLLAGFVGWILFKEPSDPVPPLMYVKVPHVVWSERVEYCKKNCSEFTSYFKSLQGSDMPDVDMVATAILMNLGRPTVQQQNVVEALRCWPDQIHSTSLPTCVPELAFSVMEQPSTLFSDIELTPLPRLIQTASHRLDWPVIQFCLHAALNANDLQDSSFSLHDVLVAIYWYAPANLKAQLIKRVEELGLFSCLDKTNPNWRLAMTGGVEQFNKFLEEAKGLAAGDHWFDSVSTRYTDTLIVLSKDSLDSISDELAVSRAIQFLSLPAFDDSEHRDILKTRIGSCSECTLKMTFHHLVRIYFTPALSDAHLSNMKELMISIGREKLSSLTFPRRTNRILIKIWRNAPSSKLAIYNQLREIFKGLSEIPAA